MRSNLAIALGVAAAGLGVGLVAHELAHGQDIWARHSALGVLILGAFLVFAGLSEKANGPSRERIWPGLLGLGVVIAIGVVLYFVSPPLLVLFGIVVVPFGLARRAWWWTGQ